MSQPPALVEVRELVGGGEFQDRLGIVLLAEGFDLGELPRFDAACDRLVAALSAVEPFPDLLDALALTALRVVAGGVDTYLEAHLGSYGIPHLLGLQWTRASDLADEHVSGWETVLVLVNATDYGGGAKGRICASTLCEGWERLVVHELGHGLFELTDEYDYPFLPGDLGSQRPPSVLDPEPANVTQDITHLKWGDLVAPGTPIPTTRNPHGCIASDTRPRPDVLAPDAVGAFEGAARYRCDIWRPQHMCLMRDVAHPFCQVCQAAIRRTLEPVRAAL